MTLHPRPSCSTTGSLRLNPCQPGILCLLLIAFLPSASLQAASPPPATTHPRLLFTSNDLASIHNRIATQTWAREQFQGLKEQADQWLRTSIVLPPRGGQWFHYYSCPEHGARLQTQSPTQHRCPIDGEILTGQPYDDVVLSSEHNRLAGAIRLLGIVYQLTQNRAYADKAKEILLAYAAKYQSYPLHNIRGEAKVGGGKVGPQTLDESTWLITVLEGTDCIWDCLTPAERSDAINGLFLPATDVIRQHKMGIHNIQCWKNSAVGMTGLLLDNQALLQEALDGPSGFFNQIDKGIAADGAWFEGAWGYHFYTVSALLHFTEAAFHSGTNLYGHKFKTMFDAPLDMTMPNLELPAFNDSHAASLPRYAASYETAAARYRDKRYHAILSQTERHSDAALLHGLTNHLGSPKINPASRNFPDSGYAILAAGDGRDATWLCLDYGPHGGGHGHPDKLGFVLYGLRKVLAPDPGTANYGVPIQAAWYRTSIAHNTLTIDERSQKPATGAFEAFLASPDFSAVTATAGAISPGVSFRRTVALVGPELLVFIDEVSSDQSHAYDLAYHNRGTSNPSAASQPCPLPDRPGYTHIRDARKKSISSPMQLSFDLGRDQAVRWIMAGGEETEFITGTGVGDHTEDRVPLVLARRRANNTTYCWALFLGAASPPIRLELARVAIGPQARSSASPPVAVEVGLPSSRHLIVTNPSGEEFSIHGQSARGKLIHLSTDEQGAWHLRNSGG